MKQKPRQIGRRLFFQKKTKRRGKWAWYNLNYMCEHYKIHRKLEIPVCSKYQLAFSQFWKKSPCSENCDFVFEKPRDKN